MKTPLIFFISTLFTYQSFSQEVEEISLDLKFQVKYADTLNDIGERLNGRWKYLGKRTKAGLIDTLQESMKNDKTIIIVVENGTVYESIGGERKKADYFYEINYSFDFGNESYSREKKGLKGGMTTITSDQPIPEMAYYKGKFGIVFYSLYGQSFEGIQDLTSERLLLTNGEEYLRME